MSSTSQAAARPKWMLWTGWGLSGLIILFLLFDSFAKLALEHHAVEATTGIGYPLAVIRPLGLVCLVCTLLYAVPRTSILGAILFGVYFGLFIWGGLYLRDDRLRALIPLRREG
jgi:DoxX-like family